MPIYKQAGRLLQFSIPTLDQDTLIIESIDGVEGMSRMFDFHVELYAESGTTVDPNDLVGNTATVELSSLDGSSSRYINGLVASFEQTMGDTIFDAYSVHMVPSLWQLTLATNCRVYQAKTVMEVIKDVISPYALSVGDVTTFAYKPLDYCTQYNETDFNFISRLAEQHGIFYWFEHTEDDHKIMFGDDISAYTPCPNVSEVQYSAQTQDKETLQHYVVSDFRVTSTMVTGKHTSNSWDYRPFKVNLVGAVDSAQTAGKNALERYSYSGGDPGYVKEMTKQLTTPAHGQLFLNSQRDASDVGSMLWHGSSSARTFLPGYTFTLTQHPRDEWNQSYLLTEVAHHVTQSPSYRGDQSSVHEPYTNRFVGIEGTRTYRPEMRTPRPRIYGPQNAVVVAPQGEEIYIDQMGRVNVRFMWDRTASINGTDNTWVRVAQAWASRGFGTYYWPRIDDEVLIQFVDGDPDDPIMVGAVYNGNATPKYALPDMSTRSGIVTRSSKQGTADNANELRFEDKKGSEQIFINAEKDMDHRVENDLRTYVMGQDSTIVDKDQLEKVGGNYNRSIGGNAVEAITGKQDVAITGAVSHKYSAAYGADIGGDSLSKIAGKQGIHVTGEVSHKYDDKMSLQIAQDLGEKIGMNWALDAGMAAYIKGGMTVVVEAGMSLTLKVGGNFVNISPAGVAISGTLVMINSGGAAGSGSPPQTSDPDDPAAPSQPKDPDKADDGTKGTKM